MDNADRFVDTTIDGRYRLTEYIGSGSYGSVYAADEVTLGRVISRVAVKIITPEHAEQRNSVLNEIVGLARLHHDYIIVYRASGVIAYGDLAGSIFVATELGDTTLAQLLKTSERLSDEQLRDMVRGLAGALAHIHSKGHTHGDVKPANIVRVKGRWKLGDLGLLRSTRKRTSGPLQGSLTFMAPEMLRHDLLPANDIYALGVTLLFYFTGRYAHAGDSREEFIENLRTKPATIPEQIPEPWRTLINRCLLRIPAHRPSAAQIEEFLGPNGGSLEQLLPQLESETPSGELPALIVGDEDGASIAEAIKRAEPGSRIIIRPGKYRDTLVVDKPLELVGDGDAEQIVLSIRDARCVEITTDGQVLLRNLTLRCRPGPKADECYVVDVGKGRLLIEDCVIQSGSLACIAVHDGSAAIVRHSALMGSQDVGAFIFGKGRGLFEDCTIMGHGRAGVSIGEGGRATFRRCQITGNQAGGVFLFQHGDGVFEECRIAENSKAGVVVGSGASGDFARCEISSNDGEGMVLQAEAIASVQYCDLRKNTGGPWRIAEASQLKAAGNKE